jgi:hypothetical protein
MAAFLIILGVVLGFIGGCNLIEALVDRNPMAALGGAAIGVVFAIAGLLCFIFGIVRASRSKALVGNTRKCPFCAEMVKPEAKVCRYCSRDLPTVDAVTAP